ncbi:MAG: Si-specific NAD(P)(+) transhydrogenase [Ignavibacteriales bacterium]|nr:Soluble pyridine nucleotide transhydrogenase [Ignavibacteriaceae bacterium]MBZ0197381.1 Si-specific NAD(P)(+) transhydrogenase [Ignavibacteriaceae bacterium]MCZ2144021.1 Si-specific NAD(P)(+) transhydrogenase [Ignavibacteriales bacterium]OQY78517.1 MAG: NAD(P)(+) transhydrogenase [Ignavibacteriales bacterium UTCHB3]WKZ73368.1 MAG: Si-specific NAD(P)(+) transhydrogenase [Ignavibacteriaceae bacterium]
MNYDYDCIVIGSGPGGEGAAMKMVKAGRRVAIVDSFPRVGGSCTHTATIPSKSLRQEIQRIAEIGKNHGITYQDILKNTSKIVDQQVELRYSFYKRNFVDVINGKAKFLDEHTLEIDLLNGGIERYTAEYFIIATGSRPYHPPDVDFSHPRILDSDTILSIPLNFRSIAIYGAGIIGCEYASIFRGLSMKVNLINTRDRLLSFLDDEISDALSYHLRGNGVMIRNKEEYTKVVPSDNSVEIFLESNKVISADVLLWAQGRTGNSGDLNLEALGIKTDSRGSIIIDEKHQTVQPHIYAVGDVCGFPSLASASYDQGRFAATYIIEGKCENQLLDFIPTGIYTIPEISSVGKTERELTRDKVPYEVGHSFFKHLARAQITGHTTGMLKILFHRETLQILGIHCFGNNASEIIHIGQAIMVQKGEANSLLYFINTTFNYPTMAEAYRVAALNGLNRVK